MNEKELLARVGATIRARRKDAGLTISQLAEHADMDPGFLGTIETGKKAPSLPTLAKLATALDVKLSELVKDVPHEPQPVDAQLERTFKALARGRSAAEKADLLAILKRLHDPASLKALRHFIKR